MIHPLALAYLAAYRAHELATGHVVPTGMPSPAMTMHRARAAWVAAGCPIEAGAVSPPAPTKESP